MKTEIWKDCKGYEGLEITLKKIELLAMGIVLSAQGGDIRASH